MELFSSISEILKDFQIHLRLTFLNIFWSNMSRLKCKNLYHTNNAALISKHHSSFSKMLQKHDNTIFLNINQNQIFFSLQCKLCSFGTFHIKGQDDWMLTLHFFSKFRNRLFLLKMFMAAFFYFCFLTKIQLAINEF